jgi:hypothetical protein
VEQRDKGVRIVAGAEIDHPNKQKTEWRTLWGYYSWKAKHYMLNDDKAVAITLANETGAGNFSAPPWTSLFVASPKLTYNKLNLYPVIAHRKR